MWPKHHTRNHHFNNSVIGHYSSQVADVEARQRLRSSSSSSLIVSRSRLSTVGDRAFPAAAARVWNSRPEHITSAPTVADLRSRLKTRLFSIVYPSPSSHSASAVTLSCSVHSNPLHYLLTCYFNCWSRYYLWYNLTIIFIAMFSSVRWRTQFVPQRRTNYWLTWQTYKKLLRIV